MDSAVWLAVDMIDRFGITGRALGGRACLLQTLGAPSGHLDRRDRPGPRWTVPR